jgi:hypothetical protein
VPSLGATPGPRAVLAGAPKALVLVVPNPPAPNRLLPVVVPAPKAGLLLPNRPVPCVVFPPKPVFDVVAPNPNPDGADVVVEFPNNPPLVPVV